MAGGGVGTEAKRSWEGEEDARKQEQPVPPVLVHKGLIFRKCGLGGRRMIVPGGLTGPLHFYSSWDTWGHNPIPARFSKVLIR